MTPKVSVQKTISKAAGRTGWEIMVDDRLLASGYCSEDKYPGAAFSALQDATEKPYEVIQRSFRPIETQDLSEITPDDDEEA